MYIEVVLNRWNWNGMVEWNSGMAINNLRGLKWGREGKEKGTVSFLEKSGEPIAALNLLGMHANSTFCQQYMCKFFDP